MNSSARSDNPRPPHFFGHACSAAVPLLLCLLSDPVHCATITNDPAAEELSKEIASKGWILFSAKSPQGDYDLFLARPNGKSVLNLTQTPDANEFGGRFSADNKRMLYRRQARAAQGNQPAINHDLWGAAGSLVIANADGSKPQTIGNEGEYPWASWNPDGTQIACLYKREGMIRIYELATRKLLKEMPRQGIFQQLFWSPDGKRLCGTANLAGQNWNIVSVDLANWQSTLLTRGLNCTPDWFQKDPSRVIYSHRSPGLATAYGWTMLMQATADGKSRGLICAEKGHHLYYGCTSPDDQYLVFSSPESDGGVDANMAIIRVADTPMIPDDYPELRAQYPGAKSGPILRLPLAGFEPHWTYADVLGRQAAR